MIVDKMHAYINKNHNMLNLKGLKSLHFAEIKSFDFILSEPKCP